MASSPAGERRDRARVGVPAPRRRRRGVVRGAARHVTDGAVLALLGRGPPPARVAAARARPLRPRGRESAPRGVRGGRRARRARRRADDVSGSAPFATTSFSSPSSQAFWSRYSKPSGRRRARRGASRRRRASSASATMPSSRSSSPRRDTVASSASDDESRRSSAPGARRRRAAPARGRRPRASPLPPAERRRRPGRAVLGAVVGEKRRASSWRAWSASGRLRVEAAARRRRPGRTRRPAARAAPRPAGAARGRRDGGARACAPRKAARRRDASESSPRGSTAPCPIKGGVPVVRAPGLPVRDVRGAPEPLVPRRAGHAARLVRRHLRLRRKTRGEVAVPGRRDGRHFAPAAAVLVVRAQHADVPLAEVARRVAQRLQRAGQQYRLRPMPLVRVVDAGPRGVAARQRDARVGEQTGDARRTRRADGVGESVERGVESVRPGIPASPWPMSSATATTKLGVGSRPRAAPSVARPQGGSCARTSASSVVHQRRA